MASHSELFTPVNDTELPKKRAYFSEASPLIHTVDARTGMNCVD